MLSTLRSEMFYYKTGEMVSRTANTKESIRKKLLRKEPLIERKSENVVITRNPNLLISLLLSLII